MGPGGLELGAFQWEQVGHRDIAFRAFGHRATALPCHVWQDWVSSAARTSRKCGFVTVKAFVTDAFFVQILFTLNSLNVWNAARDEEFDNSATQIPCSLGGRLPFS